MVCALTRHDALGILGSYVSHAVPVAGVVGALGCALGTLEGPRDHRVAATNSQSCAGRTTDQRSPMRTGPCWVRSRRPCPDGGELAGSSRQRPCCVGTDAESPATGPNPAGRLGGPAPLWNCVTSSSTWPPTTPPGVTAASPANSPDSATASEHRQCGESSNSTASTPPHSARGLPGLSSCAPSEVLLSKCPFSGV